jgi:hypothetical protein
VCVMVVVIRVVCVLWWSPRERSRCCREPLMSVVSVGPRLRVSKHKSTTTCECALIIRSNSCLPGGCWSIDPSFLNAIDLEI